MEHGNHDKGLFFRSVSDEVISHHAEPQRPRSEIRSFVALAGKSDELPNCVQYISAEGPGGDRVVSSNEFPDFRDVLRGPRVKFKTLVAAHFGG